MTKPRRSGPVAEAEASSTVSKDGKAPQRERVAVIIVHGMGEQRPLETVNQFVDTALTPIADPKSPENRKRVYYSRPTVLTNSYEARVLLAIERHDGIPVSQLQTDFYEYHWSYLMTGNVISDLLPLTKRLLIRVPWNVPGSLRLAWLVLWAAIAGLIFYVWKRAPDDLLKDFSVGRLISTLFPHALVAAVVAMAVFGLIASLTSTFVDVARYLDTSPRSYEVRRAIRGGMVDLLKTIQDSGRYARMVVVAHSLGAYISYDAMTSLWTEQTARMNEDFTALAKLADAANGLPASNSNERPCDQQLADYRAAQLSLWQEMRAKGLPWLITDFISVGTPMYFADLLITPNRKRFTLLRKRSELPQCPPRSDTETVEGGTPEKVSYGWRGRPRLVTGSPFAVVRWSNFWFPSKLGVFGDWFGGPLQPLFGSGVSDTAVTGNRPWRYVPGGAHSLYFSFPEWTGHDDVAPLLREALALNESVIAPHAKPG